MMVPNVLRLIDHASMPIDFSFCSHQMFFGSGFQALSDHGILDL
jgi:hypothetical protein